MFHVNPLPSLAGDSHETQVLLSSKDNSENKCRLLSSEFWRKTGLSKQEQSE